MESSPAPDLRVNHRAPPNPHLGSPVRSDERAFIFLGHQLRRPLHKHFSGRIDFFALQPEPIPNKVRIRCLAGGPCGCTPVVESAANHNLIANRCAVVGKLRSRFSLSWLPAMPATPLRLGTRPRPTLAPQTTPAGESKKMSVGGGGGWGLGGNRPKSLTTYVLVRTTLARTYVRTYIHKQYAHTQTRLQHLSKRH